MIEACIRGGDLPGISDFLQKMEAAGFCPPSNLLDKVMDLYAWQKGESPMTMPLPEAMPMATEFVPGSPEHGIKGVAGLAPTWAANGPGSGMIAMEGDSTWPTGAAEWDGVV